MLNAIYSEFKDDPDMADLVDSYVSSVPEKLEIIEKCISTEDVQTLARVVHQLKGSAGSYGFPAITSLAAELEQSLLRGASAAEVQQPVEDLVDSLKRMTC
jgi:HPt (histidine-containing phosphotransfer) domain-containing protein